MKSLFILIFFIPTLLACSPEQFLKNIAGKNSKNDTPKTEEKAEPKLIWSRFDSKDMAKSFPNAVLSCELYYFQSKLTSDELPSQPADGFQWKVSESPNTKTIPLSFFKSKKEYLKAKLSKINFEIGYWQGKAASPQFRLIFDLDVQWSYNRENQNLDWQYVDYYLEQKETPSLLHTLDYRSTRTGTDRVKRQRLFCQLDLGY